MSLCILELNVRLYFVNSVWNIYIFYSTHGREKKYVTSGGVRCSKWTPIYIYIYIYIYKRPTHPLSIRRINERKEKQRSWHWTNIWPWVPAGPDSRCERAGWLPAVSFCFFCWTVSGRSIAESSKLEVKESTSEDLTCDLKTLCAL
jgi:hypothetical protein